ncbi:MAG TPA: hypothetical protein VM488_05370 [Pseudobacter sp.]|jgi:hypothetical protein|nr:hypothetical protein [Pseudobacter sp.]
MENGIEITIIEQRLQISKNNRRLFRERLLFLFKATMPYGLFLSINLLVRDYVESLYFTVFSAVYWVAAFRLCFFWHRKHCISVQKKGEEEYLINNADCERGFKDKGIEINLCVGKKSQFAVGDVYLRMNGWHLILNAANESEVDAIISSLNQYFNEELVVSRENLY